MSKLQLLSGPAVEEAMKLTGLRQIFRYDLNNATIGLLLAIGLLCFIAALLLWLIFGLGGLMTVGFIIILFIGMSFFSMASYWGNFRRTRFIAIADDFLFVGSDQKAWKIHWSLIDKESLNFDDLQLSRLHGELKINTANQQIGVPLFTPFVILSDLEGLIFELLQRLEVDPIQELEPSPKTRVLHATPISSEENADDLSGEPGDEEQKEK